MRTLCITAFFFCWISFTTLAQVEQDTLVASQYFKKADSLLNDRKLDSSVVYFKRALPIYQKASAWERVASCYNKIAENQYFKFSYEESIQIAKRSLRVSETNLPKNNKHKANSYDLIGDSYLKLSYKTKALNFYKKALEIQKKIFNYNHRDIANSYQNIGTAYREKSEAKKALIYYKKGLAIYLKVLDPQDIEIGNMYNSLGIVYNDLGEFDKALWYYNEDLKITEKNKGKNHIHMGYSYNNLGALNVKMMQYEEAFEYYKKALKIFEEKKSLYPSFVISNNMINTLAKLGRYNTAEQYFKKSINLGEKIFDKKHPDIAACYINMGVILNDMEEFDEAIAYYNKALQICLNYYGKKHSDISLLYKNIGDAYVGQEDLDNAISYYNKALDISKSLYGHQHLDIATLFLKVSDVYLKKREYEKALEQITNSIDFFKESYGEKSLVLLDPIIQKANIFFESKKFNKSIEFYNMALEINQKNDTNNAKEPKLNSSYNKKLFLEALYGKAKAHSSLFNEKRTERHLLESNKIFTEIEKSIAKIRSFYSNNLDKIFFAKKSKIVYSDIIKNRIKYNEYKSNTDKGNLNNVFYCFEKSRANNLMDLVNTSKAENFGEISADLVSKEKKQKTDLAYYNSLIIAEQSKEQIDSTKISEYENKLFDISRQQDSLTTVLEQNYPKYYQLKYQNKVVSINEIQEQLSEKTTLLEYFVADSTTYLFTISKKEVDIQTLPTKDLDQTVVDVRTAIINKDLPSYKVKALQLYNTLIAPIKEKIVGDELIIIPDESLWHLNFDLLLSQEDTSNNPKDLSYLLKDYAISYANSATLLFQDTTTPSTKKEHANSCLAFSFSDSTQVMNSNNITLATLRDAGDDLPGTRDEIKSIATIVDGQYFYGAKANEATFKQHANEYGILHLALHGEIDDQNPQNSKLYFTKSKDTIEDNVLYAHELFALEVPAELAVLSACNTGAGKIAKGEGIMSLGTAFQYAGTKSLLLTSWEISDQITPQLMQHFYSNLKEGHTKSKALQQAKLHYLTSAAPERTHPWYWGGFYLVGDAGVMDLNTGMSWFWILGLGIVGVLLVWVIYVKKRNLKV